MDDIAELVGGKIEKSDEYRVSLKDPLWIHVWLYGRVWVYMEVWKVLGRVVLVKIDSSVGKFAERSLLLDLGGLNGVLFEKRVSFCSWPDCGNEGSRGVADGKVNWYSRSLRQPWLWLMDQNSLFGVERRMSGRDEVQYFGVEFSRSARLFLVYSHVLGQGALTGFEPQYQMEFHYVNWMLQLQFILGMYSLSMMIMTPIFTEGLLEVISKVFRELSKTLWDFTHCSWIAGLQSSLDVVWHT